MRPTDQTRSGEPGDVVHGVGVILYGPPAAGKDTITAELHRLDARFRQFERVKVGVGRSAGYRMATPTQLDQLRRAGDVVWENHRYDSTYVIDRPALLQALTGHVPVVHVGQVEAIDAIHHATPHARWVLVQVWCDRPTAEARIEARATGDTPARLSAWDATEKLTSPDLDIDTDQVSPREAADLIAGALTGR